MTDAAAALIAEGADVNAALKGGEVGMDVRRHAQL